MKRGLTIQIILSMISVSLCLGEGEQSYWRSVRENLCLQVGGFVIATYWMDVHPRRGIPGRGNVQRAFHEAGFGEEYVVSPLAIACAEDPKSTLNNEQKLWVSGATTFEQLEAIIDQLDPQPADPEDPYVRVRKGPITRDHIATVLQPTIAQLGEQLTAEGHTPYNVQYFLNLKAYGSRELTS